MDVENKTKFAKDLQLYFPDIYILHVYGKTNPWFWTAVHLMKKMKDSDVSGTIEVRYSNGNIDRVMKHEIVEKIR